MRDVPLPALLPRLPSGTAALRARPRRPARGASLLLPGLRLPLPLQPGRGRGGHGRGPPTAPAARPAGKGAGPPASSASRRLRGHRREREESARREAGEGPGSRSRISGSSEAGRTSTSGRASLPVVDIYFTARVGDGRRPRRATRSKRCSGCGPRRSTGHPAFPTTRAAFARYRARESRRRSNDDRGPSGRPRRAP